MVYKVYVNEKKLSYILTSLSVFCKNKIRFYCDYSQRYLGEYRENLSFCRILEKSPKSNHLCTQCDEYANQCCREAKNGFHYYCHANLIEIIHPVRYGGVYVGNIGFGQFRSKKRFASDDYFAYLEDLTKIDKKKLKSAYNSQPLLSDIGIEGAKVLLELCANKLCEAGVFSIDYRDSINKIEQYIKENLSGDLSLINIAAHTYLNPSYISAMYHKATGTTVSQYIQNERVNRAMYLISNTTMSVAELSSAVGFKDPNYFSKVFRKKTGLSPREYRQKLSIGDIIP